jgi:NAD(P)H-quinone oxidoreductase subunit 5
LPDLSSCLVLTKWIVLLPFIASAFIIAGTAIFRERMPKTLCMVASVGAVTYGFFESLLIFGKMTSLAAQPATVFRDWVWFASDSFHLTVGILIDNLSSAMLLVVTAVSLLVQIYTHGYMREDPGYRRFYAYLSLFTGSMLGFVIATNLVQSFIFWELVGVCSYLLIGFWWHKETASAACLKAFVVNRIGDFGFLVGVLIFLACTYGFWHGHLDHGLLSFYDPTTNSALEGVNLAGAIKWAMAPSQGLLTQAVLTTVAVIMFMGPMAKSAQFPLHVWLPDAMEGPTPISALIHAATMVAAGVYLVARAYPIWLNWTTGQPETLSTALTVVAWVGGFTAFMAATVAITQNDIKRALAWSTVSQLGYMFVGLGVGAYSAGMFHLTTHAFFKAMLFLCSGAVIHALHGEQDMRNMGGLWKKTPITFACFLIGTLAISGCPGLSGFFSKDEIIGSAFGWQGWNHELLSWLTVATAGMTAYYMFRMVIMTFWGEYRGKAPVHEEKLPGDPLTWPLMVFAIPSVLAGGIMGDFSQFFSHFGTGEEYCTPFARFVYFMHPHFESINTTALYAGTSLALAGFIVAMLLYFGKGYEFDRAFEQKLPFLYRFSLNRWYMDDVFLGGADFFIRLFRQCWEVVDKFFVDGVVNSFTWVTLGLGGFFSTSQSGRGQAYALMIFAGVAVLGLVTYYVFVP